MLENDLRDSGIGDDMDGDCFPKIHVDDRRPEGKSLFFSGSKGDSLDRLIIIIRVAGFMGLAVTSSLAGVNGLPKLLNDAGDGGYDVDSSIFRNKLEIPPDEVDEFFRLSEYGC